MFMYEQRATDKSSNHKLSYHLAVVAAAGKSIRLNCVLIFVFGIFALRLFFLRPENYT